MTEAELRSPSNSSPQERVLQRRIYYCVEFIFGPLPFDAHAFQTYQKRVPLCVCANVLFLEEEERGSFLHTLPFRNRFPAQSELIGILSSSGLGIVWLLHSQLGLWP